MFQSANVAAGLCFIAGSIGLILLAVIVIGAICYFLDPSGSVANLVQGWLSLIGELL